MNLWRSIKADDHEMGEHLLVIIGGRLHKCQGAHVEVREETILTFHFTEAESHVSLHCIILL